MSYYYLSHRTIRHLVQNAKRNATFADVLSWMSSATEYDELPVRHNEDLINAELSKNLPLPASSFNDLPMWDPHVKAFLLLQAHMSRIDLPITDYVGDQTSVLDQAIRIIQASIDVLTELAYLSSCLQMIALLQCIKSARWPTDYPLSILPGVSIETPEIQVLPHRLQDFAIMSEKDYQHTISGLQIPQYQLPGFHKAANMIPNLNVDLQNLNALSLTVVLSRQNPFSDREVKMYSPRFPKPQTEGWFVILGKEDTDEIIAIKRASWDSADSGDKRKGNSSMIGNRPIARAVIKFPEEEAGGFLDGRKVDVLVASDGYPGMLYKIGNIEIPDVPKVIDESGKKDKEKTAGIRAGS
jgi:antiviral helicase SLH1